MARLGTGNSIDKNANGSIAEAKVNARVKDAQTDTAEKNRKNHTKCCEKGTTVS